MHLYIIEKIYINKIKNILIKYIYIIIKIKRMLVQKESNPLRERGALSVKAPGLIAGET